MLKARFNLFAWGVNLALITAPVYAWGSNLSWRWPVSTYKLFPLFGLIAFSLMLAMYVVGFMSRRLEVEPKELGRYFQLSSFLVIVAICLHPGLLIWQLWRDGFGLPPGNYFGYVATSLRWALVLSSISFLIFLVYELRHKFRQRPWFRYMEYLVDLAVVAIFIHALALGSLLQHGWFRHVWYAYGFLLLGAFCDIYGRKIKQLH